MTIYKKAIISVFIHILSIVGMKYGYSIALIVVVLSAPFAYIYGIQGFSLAMQDEKPTAKIFVLALPIVAIIFVILAILSLV